MHSRLAIPLIHVIIYHHDRDPDLVAIMLLSQRSRNPTVVSWIPACSATFGLDIFIIWRWDCYSALSFISALSIHRQENCVSSWWCREYPDKFKICAKLCAATRRNCSTNYIIIIHVINNSHDPYIMYARRSFGSLCRFWIKMLNRLWADFLNASYHLADDYKLTDHIHSLQNIN